MHYLPVGGEIERPQMQDIVDQCNPPLHPVCLSNSYMSQGELAYKEDTMEYTTIGIDVSKAKLDICFLSTGETITVSNDLQGFKLLLKKINKSYDVAKIIIEHTGNYQRNCVMFLQRHNFSVCVVNPNKVRNFAKAAGILAKTDRIDAYVLAKYGEMFNPEETKDTDKTVAELRELVSFRAQLVEACKLFKARLEKEPSVAMKKEVCKVIAYFEKQEKDINKKIKEFIAQHQEMLKKAKSLLSINGIGEQTVNILLSYLPELGNIEKNKLSALCGLAPINHDSGNMRGLRCINGGRKIVRNALYMATVSASVHNPIIRNHYLALKARGKPSKVALVACMRKLVCYANLLMKNL